MIGSVVVTVILFGVLVIALVAFLRLRPVVGD